MIDLRYAALASIAWTVVVFTLGVVIGANNASEPLPPEPIRPVEWALIVAEADRAKLALDSIEVWLNEMAGVWVITTEVR